MNHRKARVVMGMILVLSVTLPSFSKCPSADLTGDCRVDLEDFTIVANGWLGDCNGSNDWCDKADFNQKGTVNLSDSAVLVAQWLAEGIPTDPEVMVWVFINDPGVPDHDRFNGQMSKYETTNAQYCQYLNAARASGDITISGNYVYGASGSNRGADFVGQLYYDLAGTGYSYNGATGGGAARIDYSGGVFTVDNGFENHPVTYVSWYGSTAFCNYYGYRLPTEWKWQAVADYDGSYTYGCGTSINNSMANYENSIHPYGTTVVGTFGTYGYGMCDMAGNVWEWTSTVSGSFRVYRGGSWNYDDSNCTVSHQHGNYPSRTYCYLGFRVCR